jgi:hypothetical protein
VWFLNWEPATCDFARAEQVAWLFGVNDVGTVCQHHRELRTWGAEQVAGLFGVNDVGNLVLYANITESCAHGEQEQEQGCIT